MSISSSATGSEPVLEALQAASPNRFKGIRHIVTWDADPRVESRETEGVLSTPEFRAGAKVLGRMGLSLDTICCFPQLPEMVAFARAVPEVTIIMNHLGGLNRTGPFAGKDAEVMAAWRAGMAELAKCPNVFLKLGGHGMPRFGFDWHLRDTPVGSEEMAAQIAPLMSYCIDQFGPEPLHVRKQLPGRQGLVLVSGAVQRLQAVLEGLFGLRTRGDVPRHRGSCLSDRDVISRQRRRAK